MLENCGQLQRVRVELVFYAEPATKALSLQNSNLQHLHWNKGLEKHDPLAQPKRLLLIITFLHYRSYLFSEKKSY